MLENTLHYFPPARYTDLPTGTTAGGFLGGANEHQAARLITIEETGSRTLLSVILRARFRDRFTVANEIGNVRMAAIIGANRVNVDRPFTQLNSADHSHEVWDADFTAHFNSFFGAGSSQTVTAALEVLTTTASNVGSCISFEWIITYTYDQTVGTRRTKSVPVPIQSHHQAPGVVQVEIGTSGTTPAPANQIPVFDTYFEESNKVYDDVAVLWQSNSDATASDTTPFVQIDAVAEVSQGVIGQALNTAVPADGVYNYDTGTYATNVAHAFKMRTDIAGMLISVGAVMWVTYSYDKASTRGTFFAIVPFVAPGGDSNGPRNSITPTSNVQADATTYVATVDIQEPGTITLKQSACVSVAFDVSGGAPAYFAGAQPARQYGGVAGADTYFVHRTDHTSGWTLARGRNDLTVMAFQTLVERWGTNGFAIVVYSADAPATGIETGNRALMFSHAVFGTAPLLDTDIAAPGSGPISITAPWKISGFFVDVITRGTQSAVVPQFYQAIQGGEFQGSGWVLTEGPTRGALGELYCRESFHALTMKYNLTSQQSGKLAPNTARRHVCESAAACLASWQSVITVHNVTYTVAGTVTIDGVAAANGNNVEIWAKDASGLAELVTTVVTTGGTGAFTAQVPDNTRSYFAAYNNGGRAGKSLLGTPV